MIYRLLAKLKYPEATHSLKNIKQRHFFLNLKLFQ